MKKKRNLEEKGRHKNTEEERHKRKESQEKISCQLSASLALTLCFLLSMCSQHPMSRDSDPYC